MGSSSGEIFNNVLLTTNHSECHELSVLITREGPSMPRRPWTQNGIRLSSTRTFIWSRYCADPLFLSHTKTHMHTNIFPQSLLCSYCICCDPLWAMWKPQRLIRHLEFRPHALSLGLFSVSSMQPLISTSKPQVNNRHSCSYSVNTDTLTACLFSKKSNRRVLGNHAHVCSSVTARGIDGCLCLFLAICVCLCCLWQTPPSSYHSLKKKSAAHTYISISVYVMSSNMLPSVSIHVHVFAHMHLTTRDFLAD